MIQIDRRAKRLRKLERTIFFNVEFRARGNEWRTSMPDALCAIEDHSMGAQ